MNQHRYPLIAELKIGQSVVVEKTRMCLRGVARLSGEIERRDFSQLRQIAGKKNPKQLMEAWDLKMHKPWW
ncbi:hypothetical protein [Pseudomonas sp. H3_C08]|jgi:hypothetical protein